ncbi:MAG: hypothetical protein R3F05_02075 [Planctomycetota bacterium]
MSRPTHRIAMGLGFVLSLAAVAFADDPFDWTAYFPLDKTMQMGATTCECDAEGNQVGPAISVQADRGPLVSGSYQIQARVRAEAGLVPSLTQMRFMVANDANGNDVIDAGEWLVLATVTPVTLPNGDALAESVVMTVSAFMDAYRIEHSYSNGLVSTDDILVDPVTAP